MAVRRALVVGNNSYKYMPQLYACVQDARRVAPLLAENEDGSSNFDVEMLLSSQTRITESVLKHKIKEFFNAESEERAEVLCFYFAGHGAYDYQEQSGYLVSYNGQEGDLGIPMEKLIGYANRANAEQVVIVLDCCHAGAIDNSFATGGLASPREGVSILAGTRDEEFAKELLEGGLFTSLLVGALNGGGANPVTGAITTANLHAFVDGALGKYDQSPLFKGNVAHWCELRRVTPVIPPETVKAIKTIFRRPETRLRLSPSYEPSANPMGHANEATFKLLQQLRNAALVETIGTEHLYYAAMDRKSVRLTQLGRYYWMLADRGAI